MPTTWSVGSRRLLGGRRDDGVDHRSTTPATTLRVSTRTLKRRLAAAGTTSPAVARRSCSTSSLAVLLRDTTIRRARSLRSWAIRKQRVQSGIQALVRRSPCRMAATVIGLAAVRCGGEDPAGARFGRAIRRRSHVACNVADLGSSIATRSLRILERHLQADRCPMLRIRILRVVPRSDRGRFACSTAA